MSTETVPHLAGLPKTPTGIDGFDEITAGGLPTGRPSLVCGSAGCGKSLFALQFLTNGALHYDEPGVLVAFEERASDIVANVTSLGIDLDDLQRRKVIVVDAISLESQNIIDTGEYDLEALIVRLGWAIKSIGAKRVAIDSIEVLFASFSDRPGLIRAELRRLFVWLKQHGLTTIITGERGDGQLTRHGIEEYVSDCVVVLDHRVIDEISTRRLRVLKYRGSSHGSNEYPFLIGDHGIEVLPITALGLRHRVLEERISTGVAVLDGLLGDQGPYRGSSILVSGGAGSGKSIVSASFAAAACERGERVLYFSFEESADQVLRNMRSVGLDLARWTERGQLSLHCERPTALGLEGHLAVIQRLIKTESPSMVVIDPISSLTRAGAALDITAMLMRQVDYLKSAGITAVFTALTDAARPGQTEQDISSLVDSWVVLRVEETEQERVRELYVQKSRGMAHSDRIQPFWITDHGLELRPPAHQDDPPRTRGFRPAGTSGGPASPGSPIPAEPPRVSAQALAGRAEPGR